MIPLAEAQKQVQDLHPQPAGTERVELADAVGRVLAESPVSDQDLPPFDRVTMDGFAVRAGDLDRLLQLRCIGEVAAGAAADRPLGEGEAFRVMTGAPLPAGADAVVMVEETREAGEQVFFEKPARAGQNIHKFGGDLQRGDTPLPVGTRITVATIPLLATLGCARPLVYRRPRVAVLTSGNELVDLSARPGPSQIRDSNRITLANQVRSAGGFAEMLEIAADDPAVMQQALQSALQNDVVLLTGGSSAGRYDFSHEVVESSGAKLWFARVAIKPGKPVLYFTLGERQIFCLPGNPVSAFVTFELLVRPALEQRQGLRAIWPVPLQVPLAEPLSAPKARDLFQVARLEPAEKSWRVRPIRWHGSGDLVSIASANALIHLPAAQKSQAGEGVAVLPMSHVSDDQPRQELPWA